MGVGQGLLQANRGVMVCGAWEVCCRSQKGRKVRWGLNRGETDCKPVLKSLLGVNLVEPLPPAGDMPEEKKTRSKSTIKCLGEDEKHIAWKIV